MRILSILILSVTFLFAQDYKETIFISGDSLAEKSISLNQAWKYSSGDDSLWAYPDFDDADWDTLNPGMMWKNFEESKWKGIGWFRKHMTIDSSLINSSVALSMNHFGASQIFLNGELIGEFGKVSAIPDSEKVYQPNSIPVALNLNEGTDYVLAVRYSNHLGISDPEWFDSWYGPLGFHARIHDLNKRTKELVVDGKMNFGLNFVIGGIFLSLSALYFLLYLFYSKRRENLYYALFAFSLALLFPSSLLPTLVFEKLDWIIVYRVMGIIAIALTFLSYLAFIYSIFYVKVPKQIWGFVVGTVIMGILLFIEPWRESLNYILPVYIFLAAIEGFRAIILAIKKKKENSWVIGAGVIVFVSFIIMIFVINLFQVRPPEVVILILLIAGLFSLPASMSVYLARTIAFTNKKLEAQVIEIKELSEKELKAQQINADLKLEREREISAKNEAELRAKAAELQSKAYEAERRMLQAENERKTKELEEARNLQLSLLPKDLPLIKGLDIAVYMETATEVGGDYYDFYENENGELTVLIGDATGHGLNAGTMVTATKSLFNSFASEPDIIETFDKISHSLKRMNFKFLSMCLMLLKFNNGKIKISSAGMPPALVYRKKLRDVEEILIKGMPLGSARSFPYELKEIDVEHGDTILLMSDGLPELFNENKEMFGYKKIREDFIEFGDQASAEIIDSFKQRMKKWSGDFPLHDDVTMVIIKMN